MEAVGGAVAVVFLYLITVFYNKTQQHHFWNFILMTQCKLCTRAAAAATVNREVADGPMYCSIYRHRLLETHGFAIISMGMPVLFTSLLLNLSSVNATLF